MKNITKNILLACVGLPCLFSSCDLLQTDGDKDPNVTEEKFLESDNAMDAWVLGTEKQLSQAVGSYAQLLEILSDDYYNQYSRVSSVFDVPNLLNTDDNVKNLQRWVGTLRESADFALHTIAKQHTMTAAQRFEIQWIRGYSFLLGGETFTGLPATSGGDVKPWRELLDSAATNLQTALAEAPQDSDRALANTLLARTYYRLGNADKAETYAKAAINASSDFAAFTYYDGANSVNNVVQEALWDNWFQPLPRLDFLDPKYFKRFATEERPIVIAKAEENYLILAEAELSKGNAANAKAWLRQLLTLVRSRPKESLIDANCEMYNTPTKPYPMSADYRVRASKDEPYRSGLVLTRSTTTALTVPVISGTSVDEAMIDEAGDDDALLEIIYLMRQEIFMAEGRRAADLGIRLPLADTEAAATGAAASYTKALIPPFIPGKGEMDNFDLDTTNKTVTIHYNMNQVIVENKRTDYVAPFFK